MKITQSPDQNSWKRYLLHGFLLCGVTLVIMHLTWMKWPDIWEDFGAELYIPWRITEGEVLYRDIIPPTALCQSI